MMVVVNLTVSDMLYNRSEDSSISPAAESESDESDFDDYKWWWFFTYQPYRIFIMYIVNTICPIAFSAFGLFTNIINILVFYRQGILLDSCTPCLVSLAGSDFVNCLIVFVNTCLRTEYLILYVGSGKYAASKVRNPNLIAFFIEKGARMCTNFACWLTLYIALERMISVTFPFHVKRIFTPKRSCYTIVVIFICNFIQQIPQLLVNKLVFIPVEGDSVLYGQVFSGWVSVHFYRLVTFINEVYLRFLIVALLAAFNIVIVVKVNSSTRIRKSTTTTTSTTTTSTATKSSDTKNVVNQKDEKDEKKQAASSSKKEDKLTRMMVFICVFFLICMLPGITLMAILFLSSYKFIALPRYVDIMMNAFMVLFENINSSCNVLFYYTMSSRFKKEFHSLCSSIKR